MWKANHKAFHPHVKEGKLWTHQLWFDIKAMSIQGHLQPLAHREAVGASQLHFFLGDQEMHKILEAPHHLHHNVIKQAGYPLKEIVAKLVPKVVHNHNQTRELTLTKLFSIINLYSAFPTAIFRPGTCHILIISVRSELTQVSWLMAQDLSVNSRNSFSQMNW